MLLENPMTKEHSTRVYLSPPHMSGRERDLLLEAFDSNWIAPLGPHVDAFEQEFAAQVGMPYAVALSSGTAALHLAMKLLGVSTGDKVVTSSLTFAATANAITYLGAEPVFIDSEARTWNMDPELLAGELDAAAKRGTLPRAVITVDIYGQCADYAPILEICRSHDVPVIEDAAEALAPSTTGKTPAPSGNLRASRSMAIRLSPPAVAGCWSHAIAMRPRRSDSWPLKPGIQHHTTSIRRSGSITA